VPTIVLRGGPVTCFEPPPDDPSGKPIGQPCTTQRLRDRLHEVRSGILPCVYALPQAQQARPRNIVLRGRWSMGDPPEGGKLVQLRPPRQAQDAEFVSCVRAELARLRVKPGVCPRCYAEMSVTIGLKP
jgi:hypothetical protein